MRLSASIILLVQKVQRIDCETNPQPCSLLRHSATLLPTRIPNQIHSRINCDSVDSARQIIVCK